MKRNLSLLLVGMVLVIVGALLKIQQYEVGQYVMLFGLAIEAFALGSIVWRSLKKIK